MRFRIPYRFPYPSGLKINALLILLSLFILTGVFAARTHNVARVHWIERKSSAERDIPLQNMLFHLDSALRAKQQIQKKWKITHDPAYRRISSKYLELISDTLREIDSLRPGLLVMTSKTPFSLQQEELRRAQELLTSEREFSVQRAREVSEGLLLLIRSAIALSVIVSAWLVLLLYRGLLLPLRNLRDATTRIREGALSCRMSETGVTELREIAQDFNSMAARLESLDQAKNEFLSTVSHEIRNPLAALKEGLALLASTERKRSAESEKKCISACLIASKRLEFMINNLLKLSHTDPSASGSFSEHDFTVRNLRTALQSAIDEVRPIAERKSMEVRFAGPDTLITAFHWEGMVQAFVNLLLNAIKYGTEGSLIEVTMTPTNAPIPSVQVEVVNAGTDIATDELPRIFDRFYRGSNSLKQQGMGIGLHVVKKVIDAHHGVIAARSVAGKTRLFVNLPRSGGAQ